MNEKAKKYAGQLFDIKRKDKTLSIMDKISHVDDSAEATYLELLHPAAVYKIYILGDIENGISVAANIKPEHLKRMWLRLQFTENMLFTKEAGLLQSEPRSQEEEPGDIAKTIAFTTTFVMGRLTGKSPARVICESKDKDQAVKELRSQYEFLKQNVGKFKKNQEIMDAIDMAIDYYDIGLLDNEETMRAAAAEQNTPAESMAHNPEFAIYDPPEKTFRKETKELKNGKKLTKCYKISITFNPSRNYPYKVTIKNCYADVIKDELTKKETIHHVSDPGQAAKVEFSIFLTSEETVDMIGSMMDNTHYYESCVYQALRKVDQSIQAENRNAWKPKN